MRDIGVIEIENKNICWSLCVSLFAMGLSLFILNTLVGFVVYYFDPTQSIYWHDLSPYCSVILIVIMLSSMLYEGYVLRQGGHSLAQQLGARRLSLVNSTPEEYSALKINQQLAERFLNTAPTLYVLPDEVGVNLLSAGFKAHDTVIILTWGALQNLDQTELYGLLAHAYQQILIGDTRYNTRLKILYSGLTSFSQIGSKVAKQGFKRHRANRLRHFATFYVAMGGMIWLLGSLGVLVTRLFKYMMLSGNTFKNDSATQLLIQSSANIHTLSRIYVHHAGSQIHSEYAESISHLCFANSLSPQSWLNIHPSIQQRIFELNPSLIQELQLDNLKKLRTQPLYSLFRSLEETDGEFSAPWTSPEPLPLLRLSPISFAIKDAIKPLNPERRSNMPRPELIERAMQTATGSREVMVAILMIRQYREFIPANAEVSRAIVDALLHLDGRVHIAIFLDACQHMGRLPKTIARQFLTKLAKIIQEDGEIGLLDALLLERVKAHLGLLPEQRPTALTEVKPQIVRLVDALLHVQQINSDNQMQVREQILARILTTQELQQFEEVSDEPLDLAEILNDIAGLLLRERLSILGIAEICLWHDRVITQDELDVLELLYWRLGFDTYEIIEQMQKKNSLMIV
ncbi:peptidase M48 [uncultured Acinetobacter sp.]|uniref:peptidase M48 n=1 Tax=uncultured Acinetobacter sp. TaxID=165433 RepID=UPI002625228F|nr:peptidase M48 [uncultured Acinetobacter sp.]